MRDQLLTVLKGEILRELGFDRYNDMQIDLNQELPEFTDHPRQWCEIVTSALVQFDIIPPAAELHRLVHSRATVHDLIDYMQRKLDERTPQP